LPIWPRCAAGPGQARAEIAAAGHHSLLMLGPAPANPCWPPACPA
jgi:hypothetical protein